MPLRVEPSPRPSHEGRRLRMSKAQRAHPQAARMGTPDRRHNRPGPSRAGFAHPTALA